MMTGGGLNGRFFLFVFFPNKQVSANSRTPLCDLLQSGCLIAVSPPVRLPLLTHIKAACHKVLMKLEQ